MAVNQVDKVHFFDIANKLEGKQQSWSPNTIKVRMVLNYKQIPYTQTYLSYPDIAPILTSLNLPPWEKEAGCMPYTCPTIVHPSIDATSGPKASDRHAMADSNAIAKHLDKVFPSRPVFPSFNKEQGAENAGHAVISGVETALGPAYGSGGVRIAMTGVADILDERGEEYFVRTRSANTAFGGKSPREWGSTNAEDDWKPFELALEPLIRILHGSEDRPNPGPFVLGTTPCYADFEIVALFAWFKAGSEKNFQRIMNLGEGEFRKLWNASEQWVYGQGEDKEWETSSV